MNRVCSERNNRGWTQAELAERVGVDKSTVVRWEAGGSIPQEKMIKMRGLFGCDIDWLIGVSNERKTVS
ncbi:helix-turn-helix transcriptional regulator [Adlercreutzia sp. ZJ141]|uniref:helix-turn-helix transcriptional regulator n=1 Tax=Adlercreutzia sp. ZJ141 TaxID=2709406 RepID=UPI0013EBC721|nr:helix-turn-helix transcriptional regulator [Adlercreutzia sp. ZJ141]